MRRIQRSDRVRQSQRRRPLGEYHSSGSEMGALGTPPHLLDLDLFYRNRWHSPHDTPPRRHPPRIATVSTNVMSTILNFIDGMIFLGVLLFFMFLLSSLIKGFCRR